MPNKRKRKPARMCLPLPTRDTTLDRVKAALKGTRFAASVARLLDVLQSEDRKNSPGIYGTDPDRLVESFVTRDHMLDYGLDKSRDIVETWKVGLELCKSRTLERAMSGQAMFYIADFPGGDIARVIADMCFFRYAYEDVSRSTSGGVTAAKQDADTVALIIETKILGNSAASIDVVELLRLFAMF